MGKFLDGTFDMLCIVSRVVMPDSWRGCLGLLTAFVVSICNCNVYVHSLHVSEVRPGWAETVVI